MYAFGGVSICMFKNISFAYITVLFMYAFGVVSIVFPLHSVLYMYAFGEVLHTMLYMYSFGGVSFFKIISFACCPVRVCLW